MAKEKNISSVRRTDEGRKSSNVSSTIQSGSKKPVSNPKPAARPSPGKKETPSSITSSIRQPSPAPRPAPAFKPAPDKKPIASGVTSSVPKPSPAPATKVGATATGSVMAEHETKVAELRSRWERLAGLAGLGALYDRFEDMTTSVNALEEQITSLRTRGYYFSRGWENQAGALRTQWASQRLQATRVLEGERQVLLSAVQEVSDLVDRASRQPALVETAEGRASDLESRIREAGYRVEGVFDKTEESVEQLRDELEGIEFLMDSLETASFKLYPEEHGVMVSKAAWLPKGTDEIEGLLFLTDSRLMFEQREEVATKKILFITTEKKLIQELLWQAPVGGVEVLEAQDKKAFLSHKEMLILRLDSNDAPPEVTVELKGADNEAWSRFIRRVQEGQLEAERYDVAPSAEAELSGAAEVPESGEATSSSLPTRCPSCGAPFPTIYKGMQQITCGYCGAVTRLDQ